MRIGEIASGTEYRMNNQFQKLIIFGIFQVFQIKKILNFLKFICQFSDL